MIEVRHLKMLLHLPFGDTILHGGHGIRHQLQNPAHVFNLIYEPMKQLYFENTFRRENSSRASFWWSKLENSSSRSKVIAISKNVNGVLFFNQMSKIGTQLRNRSHMYSSPLVNVKNHPLNIPLFYARHLLQIRLRRPPCPCGAGSSICFLYNHFLLIQVQ